MHSPVASSTPINPFTDADLSDGAVRTFTLLCKLDRGPRGCFAHRETLAKWRGLSVSAINHQVADLKRRGYITVSRKGRNANESSIIHVVDQARYALLSLLPDELQSQLYSDEEEKECTCSSDSSTDGNLLKSANGKLQKSTNLQESANGHVIKEYCLHNLVTTKNMVQGTKANADELRSQLYTASAMDPVVSPDSVEGFTDPPEPDACTNECRPARPAAAETDENPVARATRLPPQVQALMEAGIDETNAHLLGHTYPARRCRAAIAYVRARRHGVKNPGGYIRFLLENDVSIPTQYFKRDLSGDHFHATDPEADSASNVIPLSVVERRTTEPADSLYAFGPCTVVCPEREKRRAESPYSSLWETVSENIGEKIQDQSYETWFQPLFITEVGKTSVVFDAPDQLVADWVEDNYIGLLTSELEAAGLSGRSIAFETSTPAS